MHKRTASFWKSTKIGQKQGVEFDEKLHNLKCAFTNIYRVYLQIYSLLGLLMETLSPL